MPCDHLPLGQVFTEDKPAVLVVQPERRCASEFTAIFCVALTPWIRENHAHHLPPQLWIRGPQRRWDPPLHGGKPLLESAVVLQQGPQPGARQSPQVPIRERGIRPQSGLTPLVSLSFTQGEVPLMKGSTVPLFCCLDALAQLGTTGAITCCSPQALSAAPVASSASARCSSSWCCPISPPPRTASMSGPTAWRRSWVTALPSPAAAGLWP